VLTSSLDASIKSEGCSEQRPTPRKHWVAVPCVVATALIAMVGQPPIAWADFDSTTGKWLGDVSASNFAEYCEGELPARRRAQFDRDFAKAERDVASENIRDAELALGSALNAAYRGGADSEVSIKCLGESIARRWFRVKLGIDRYWSENRRRGGSDTAKLRTRAVDQGEAAVVSFAMKMKARKFVSAIRTLEGFADRLDQDRDFGAFLLTEEEALIKTSRQAAKKMRAHAAKAHRDALAREQKEFNRPVTDQERDQADSLENAQNALSAFVGSDVGSIGDKDELVVFKRASFSQESLRSARDWNVETYANRPSMPSSKRARKRGDAMLERGNDKGASLRLREAFYREAKQYYNFGGFEEASAQAESARASIQPGLEAERDRQDKALDRAGAQLEKDAEAIRQGAADMIKTDSEKESFDDEADAMEDELGF
jgi:hypothetical protein